MTKSGKRMRSSLESIDRNSLYSVEDAVKIVKDNAKVKFDETVEIAMNLGVDPRHSDQHSRVSTAHERPKRAARPSVLDSLLGTHLDAPGHGLHGLYDGALHGARRLRDLREDRRARHRARRHLHLHRRAAAGRGDGERRARERACRDLHLHRDHNRCLHLR